MIQTTTPYNLLWLDYGKYFFKSQAFFTPRIRFTVGTLWAIPGWEREKGKMVIGRMNRTIYPKCRQHLTGQDEKNSNWKPWKGVEKIGQPEEGEEKAKG